MAKKNDDDGLQRGIYPKRRQLSEAQRSALLIREIERSAQTPKLDQIQEELRLLLLAADPRESDEERAFCLAKQKLTKADIGDPEVRDDAELAWATVHRMQESVRSIERLVGDGIFLGKLLERLRVRVHDDAVRKQKISTRQRSDAARITNAKRRSKLPDYEKLVAEQITDGKNYQSAIETVAKDLDCDPRTVRSHTTKLQPSQTKKKPRAKR